MQTQLRCGVRHCTRVHLYTKTSSISCMQPHHGVVMASYSSHRALYVSSADFQLSSKICANFLHQVSLSRSASSKPVQLPMRVGYPHDNPGAPLQHLLSAANDVLRFPFEGLNRVSSNEMSLSFNHTFNMQYGSLKDIHVM